MLKLFLDEVFISFKQSLKLDITLKNIYTAAALGTYCFFKLFNKNKIKQQIPKETEVYIKNAFFGGRCEVFGNPQPKDHIYYYDFEGMYGQCLAEANVFGRATYQKYTTPPTSNKLSPGFYNVD